MAGSLGVEARDILSIHGYKLHSFMVMGPTSICSICGCSMCCCASEA